MPYRKAYSFGENSKEALVNLKVNELSFDNIIEKNEIYEIKKPKNITNKKFELFLNNCISYKASRKKTKCEKRAYNYLVSVYGYAEFDKIMDLYNNDSNIALCYLDTENIDDIVIFNEDIENKYKIKCYRFLY